jgi:hypothetical protein
VNWKRSRPRSSSDSSADAVVGQGSHVDRCGLDHRQHRYCLAAVPLSQGDGIAGQDRSSGRRGCNHLVAGTAAAAHEHRVPDTAVCLDEVRRKVTHRLQTVGARRWAEDFIYFSHKFPRFLDNAPGLRDCFSHRAKVVQRSAPECVSVCPCAMRFVCHSWLPFLCRRER